MESSSSSATISIQNPTNNLVTQVPQTTDSELQAAVESAQKAFPAWKATSLLQRQQFMFRFVSLIRQNWDRLATSITIEQGKTFADAKGDVLRGLQVAETACGITTQMGDFPAMIPLWTIPLAIITGNCMILKPSERDPGAAMILAELAQEAGLPDGVLNIIHGGARTVDFIIDSPAIKAISFVGSNRVGEYIYNRGSANGKRVQANLGAKNHAVLLPDADKNHAINAIVGAAFGAAGQRCMALSTLVTVGRETEDWVSEIANQAGNLKVTAGFEADVDVGPLISKQSKERIEGLIQSAEKEGAKILLDGRGYVPEMYPNGNWVGP
ncbi:MAG: F-actin-capping protein subunit beta [Watsoniomyces obsoletus]|nr:MAG: F-actin-capping protein subunit beta [Watsoniomyces obsoletus]